MRRKAEDEHVVFLENVEAFNGPPRGMSIEKQDGKGSVTACPRWAFGKRVRKVLRPHGESGECHGALGLAEDLKQHNKCELYDPCW